MPDTRRISAIKVGTRHRRDLGDVRALADSLAAVGLLHPVVVTPRGRLVAGRRRLEAAKLLGWRPGKASDKAGALLGVSGRHLEKIAFVCESGYPDLVQEMDATGKVHRAYADARKRNLAESVAGGRAGGGRRLLCADCREVLPTLADDSFDAAVTDPVFGLGVRYGGRREEADNPADYWRFFGPVYRELLRVVKPGGLVAVWQTSKWLPYFGQWYGRDMRVFVACKGYVQLYDVPMNHAYDPVVCLWKPGARPLVPSAPRRTHDYFVSNMHFDGLARQHPCPRPLDLCEHLVENFVVEGGRVLDPFAGSGTIPLACARLGRPWLAVEVNRTYCKLMRRRLRLHGVQA